MCALKKEKWLSVTKKFLNVTFIVASARNLPFRPGVFSAVLLKDVLHHIPKEYSTLVIAEAFKAVKCSGILRIVEANRYHINPLIVYKKDNSHDHFTLSQLKLLQKTQHFDDFFGFELPPAFSTSKKHFLWNFFVAFFWLSSNIKIGQRSLFLFINVKERLVKSSLSYYVITKNKAREY